MWLGGFVLQMRAAAAAAAVAVAAAAAARAAFLRSKWCVTRTVEPAGRLAAQLWISEEGSPVAALSSLMVLTGRMGDEEVVVAGGDDDDVTGEDVVVGGGLEGFAAVATKLPSSRRDRLNPGSYEADPEICENGKITNILRCSTASVEYDGRCGR